MEYEIKASTTMTITDLRDMLGHELLGYQSGWTHPPLAKTTASTSSTTAATPGKKVLSGTVSLGGAASRTPTLTIQTVGKKKTVETKKEPVDTGVSYLYNSVTGLTPSAPSSSSSSTSVNKTLTNTAATEDQSAKWRLRRTNAHAEAMELIEEIESVAGMSTHPLAHTLNHIPSI